MFLAALNAARRLDLWLGKTFGRPYHVLLGAGIVIEIVQHVREMVEHPPSGEHLIRSTLAILLFLALLVHQIGELSEHAEQRRRGGD
jgi:hypothetical protein